MARGQRIAGDFIDVVAPRLPSTNCRLNFLDRLYILHVAKPAADSERGCVLKDAAASQRCVGRRR
jgi:hypothetical protein